jgi:two-component system chemotaxis response regulator CheY
MKTAMILVADDSPSMRQVLSGALTRAGYEVLEAGDGAEAIEQVRQGAHPDLALIDFNMPGLDGLDVVRALRNQVLTRFIPIVMVTTETRRERRTEARQAGATGWIVKPFRLDVVLDTVRRLLPPT